MARKGWPKVATISEVHCINMSTMMFLVPLNIVQCTLNIVAMFIVAIRI